MATRYRIKQFPNASVKGFYSLVDTTFQKEFKLFEKIQFCSSSHLYAGFTVLTDLGISLSQGIVRNCANRKKPS